MNVTFLAANLAENSLGRVILLAQSISKHHRVKSVGPCFGSKIWAPAEGCGIEMIALPAEGFPQFAAVAMRILRNIAPGPVIACKPLLPSFGIALLQRKLLGNPVVLDIDDDEIAMTEPGRARSTWRQWRDPLSYPYTRRCWDAASRADGVFSIADVYQRQFGGVVIPHAKDTDFVNPDNFDRAICRAAVGIPQDAEVVAFVGTPRAHKGIDLIVGALQRLERPNLRLLLVGADPTDDALQSLLSPLGGRVIAVAPQPAYKMPAYLATADLVVLPQHASSAGSGQGPAKLFDAMAMALPVVATAVGDVPKYLLDCGVLVIPGDVAALTSAIELILAEPQKSKSMGQRGRQRCVSKFSFNAIRPLIEAELTRVEAGRRESKVAI